jgi:hypothetical protein
MQSRFQHCRCRGKQTNRILGVAKHSRDVCSRSSNKYNENGNEVPRTCFDTIVPCCLLPKCALGDAHRRALSPKPQRMYCYQSLSLSALESLTSCIGNCTDSRLMARHSDMICLCNAENLSLSSNNQTPRERCVRWRR